MDHAQIESSTGHRQRISALGSTIRRLVGQAPWGVADQGLISVANLAVMVLVAREVGQTAFGRFVIVYSVLWLINIAQNGLITQPHNLIGSSLRRGEYRRYTGSILAGQAVLTGVSATAIFIAWAVLDAVGWVGSPLVLGLAGLVVCWQGREFTRRVLYTEGRVGAALANDVVCYAVQIGSLVVLGWFDALTGTRALWSLAAANALGAAAGCWRIRRSCKPGCRATDLLENWRVGRWLVGGQLVTGWLSGGLLLYLTAGVLGVVAAGVLQAIHTLFGPGRVLSQALVTMLPIRLSRALTEADHARLRAEVRRAVIWVGPALGVLCVGLAVFSKPILDLVYGADYAAYAWTMVIYAGAVYLAYLGMIPSAALKSARATHRLFMNRLTAALIGVPIGVGLMWALGLAGAALGYLIVDGLQAALDYWAYHRLLGHTQGPLVSKSASTASPAKTAQPVEVPA